MRRWHREVALSVNSGDQGRDAIAALAEGFVRRLEAGQALTAPEQALLDRLDHAGQGIQGVVFEHSGAGVVVVATPAESLGGWLLRSLRRSRGGMSVEASPTLDANELPRLAERFARQGQAMPAAGAALLALRLKRTGTNKVDAAVLELAARAQERLDGAGEHTLGLGLSCWLYDGLRRRLDEDNVHLLRSGLALCERLLGNEQTSAALYLIQRVQVVCQREFGPEHSLTRGAAGLLARALSLAGDAAAAERVRTLAGMLPERAEPKQPAQGDVDEAARTIRMRIEALGDKHPETLSQAALIALRLLEQGRYEAARRLGLLVYERRQRLLGPEHPHTLTSAGNLACALRAQGDLAGARGIEESVYETRQRVLGPEHPDTLISANNLAETLRNQRDLAGARRIHESVYETRQRVLGPAHSDTLISASNLASTLHTQGDLAGARRIVESVYETRLRAIGSEHPDTLNSANNLAEALSAQGDLAGARRIHESVYETRQRVLGPEHPDTLISANNLASTLHTQGDLAGARRIVESVYETRLHVLGPEHPHTLTSANNLAQLLHELREIEAAGSHSAQLLARLVKVNVANGLGFQAAASCPILFEPTAAWPYASLSAVVELLPRLSQLLTHHLELLPHESWDPQYALYEAFHRRWVAFALLRAPDHLLLALSGLHGIRSSSQVQAESRELQAVVDDASNPASPAVAHYLHSRASVNRLRELTHTLFNRDGPNAPGLAEIREQERKAAVAREKAEVELARMAPDLAAGLGVLGRLSEDELRTSLQADEAWLTVTPTEPPVGLLLRPDRATERVRLGALGALRGACDAYCQALRDGRQGSLRDSLQATVENPLRPKQEVRVKFMGFGTPSPQPEPEVKSVTLVELFKLARQLCADAFWAPLSPHLVGVRRLHLVTASGQHEWLLEFALPDELSSLEVHRYNGLAAFQRSLLPDVREAESAPLPLLVITDAAERSGKHIPFTGLDALVPQRRGLAQRVSAQELLVLLRERSEPVAVLISAHGDVAGRPGGGLGGGHVRLPGEVDLDPKTLALLRGPIAWLMWMSCWAARVVHGEHGEPYGSISTLQHKGLRGGIGCLAPVSDFYGPLLSAAVWHERLQGATAAAALTRAKRRLTGGDWAGMEDDIEALRREYRDLMLKLLAPLREQAGRPGWDPGRWQDETLQQVVQGWPLEAALVHTLQGQTVALVLGSDLAQHEAVINGCLESLFMPANERLQEHDERSQRVQAEIERFCAVVVAFGRD